MLSYYPHSLANCFNFRGRARRTEFWIFALVNFAVGFTIGIIEGLTGNPNVAVVGGVFQLIVFIPSISLFVRRLHDTGRSGWWWFFPFVIALLGMASFIPAIGMLSHGSELLGVILMVVGGIAYLIAMIYPIYIGCLRSVRENKWGAPADQI